MIVSHSLELAIPVPKPSHEVDVEMFTFIERYVTNLARWDLLVFFGRNPTALDGAEAIATRVGRAARLVQKELDDLVYLGVLRTQREEDAVRYGLARSPATRRAVIRMARDFGART